MNDKYCKCDFCTQWFKGKCQEECMYEWHRRPYCAKAIKLMVKALKESKTK